MRTLHWNEVNVRMDNNSFGYCLEKNCCQSSEQSNKCPVCGLSGQDVSKCTVEHLVTDNYRAMVNGTDYKICLNENCDVVYYSLITGIKFSKDQVKVPIWFKKDAFPKYACYCSKVTEEQVIDAVVIHGAETVKDVNQITGAMKNSNCRENNPMGVCCHKIIKEIINKALAD